MANKQLGFSMVGDEVYIALDGQPIDHTRRLTVSAGELLNLTHEVVRAGVRIGTEQAKRTGPMKRYIQRDKNGRIVALIEEPPPTAEEAPAIKVPVKKVAPKQIGFQKR